ncbi:MAG: radical SAM protein [Acidobacteriota bacterium]
MIAAGRTRATDGPRYLALAESGELARRAAVAVARLASCDLCPHRCHADRTAGPFGLCCIGRRAVVHGWGPHLGEEPPIRGTRGSGTVFFSGCNLSCVFCQNWETSHLRRGRETSPDELAEIMLALQRAGCHNINLVSPTHVLAQVLEALPIAVDRGLRLPLVWNSGGYDAVDALALLDGVVDIYMPDAKYGADEPARTLSGAPDYVAVNRAALREMHRQVGDLEIGPDGLARRGLLVRHLVLPGRLAASEAVFDFLAREISPNTAVNVMDQYRPCWRADEHPPADRPLTRAEFEQALASARRAGLSRFV